MQHKWYNAITAPGWADHNTMNNKARTHVVKRTVRPDGTVMYAGGLHRVIGFDPEKHSRLVWIVCDIYGCPLMAHRVDPRDGWPNTGIGKLEEVFA